MGTFVMDSLVLASIGLICILGGWGHYLSTIPRNVVPKIPKLMIVTQILGLIFVGASLLLGEFTTTIYTISGIAIFMAIFFFLLFSLRNTPIGQLKVTVGSPMLAFECMDSSGNIVNSDSWRGQRIFLKFFRGHW